MVTTTTTYSFKKPTVGDDEDVWGGYLNDSMDLIDDVLDGTTPVTGIDINSGTIDNAVIGGTTPVAGTFTALTANTSFSVTGNITVSGTVDGRDVAADGTKLDGIENGATADQTKADIDALGIAASTASTLANARNIALTGAVTGNVNFDGSSNVSIATTATSDPTLTLSGDASGSATFTNLGNATLSVTIADDSHNHVISNVDGLQTALDGKLGSTAKAADSNLLDGIDSSGYARFNSSGTINNALADAAWVTNYASSSNVDHVWHDDTANAWNFVSDSTFKAAANSRVNANSFYANGNEVWHAGNDGSGSGLDADLLDGVHGSSFLRSDTGSDFSGTLNYTPDTGTILSVDGQAILQRMTANGAITIGHDDAVIIAGGDTSITLNANISNATETVFVGAEGGLVAYAFPNNDTSWSNRKELNWNGTDLTLNSDRVITTGDATQDYGLITGSVTLTNDYGALS